MRATGASLRRDLARQLTKSDVLKSSGVRRAFERVAREVFIPDVAETQGLAAVYQDQVYVTKTDASGAPISSSSQPSIMACMLEMLDVSPGHRILEIGAGTGYNAALLATITGPHGRVTTIDIDRDLCRRARKALKEARTQVRVVTGDGHAGHPAGAPYDRIIVTASTAVMPRSWFEQLAPEGIIVVPLRLREDIPWQSVVAFRREPLGLVSSASTPGGFMGLRTSEDAPAPVVVPEHALAISEQLGAQRRVHAYVTGPPVGRISGAARKRLLTALTGSPRSERIGVVSSWPVLSTIAVHTIPPNRLVSFSRSGAAGVGAIDLEGRGITILVASKGRVSVERYGSSASGRLVRQVIREWKRLGSPKGQDMVLRIQFDGRVPRGSWRRFTLGDARASIDWRAR